MFKNFGRKDTSKKFLLENKKPGAFASGFWGI